MSCNRGLLSCLVGGVWIAALWLTAAAPAAGADPPLLQAAPDPPRAEGLPQVFNAIRSRFVRIDAALLAPDGARRLELNLFENVSFAVALEATDQVDTWRGVVESNPPGTFTMVRRGDLYAASIRVPGHMTYRIRPLDNGLHLVQELDESALAPCGNDDAHAVGVPGGVVPGAAAAALDTQVIDVLVVYTESVKSQAGGQGAIETDIDLFVAETNAAYANSQINTQLNLVYAGEVDYDDVENSPDHLSLLTNPEDGELDEVHGLRYNHQADMVALLVSEAPYCGVAWLMWSNSPSMDDVMFSVTVWSCGGLVFAHELGHNMGCCHAPGDGGGCGSGGLYPYSVGYRYNGDSGALWRTVMAYSPGSRIPHFSNPDVFFDGERTGVSGQADNALTIDQTSPTIAAFRSSLPYCDVAKNVASDGETIASLGFSMATDEGALVVGAPFDNDNGEASGSAYVYAYDADLYGWVEQDKLIAADGAPLAFFGYAVALEGGVAVIGAPRAGDNGPDSGAAYVFRYNPGLGQWVQEAELLPADGSTGDLFGNAVAVSGDVAVVAAPSDDDGGPESGSVYVFGFESASGEWTEQEKILASDGAADIGFGGAVAADGDVVIVGAPAAATTGVPGAAYLFGYDGGASSWIEEAKIQPSDSSPGDDFGTAIAIDGDLMIVGASGAGGDSGAAYVYRHDGSAWSQEARIVADDGAADDAFGQAVAIGGDLAIVGSPSERDHGLFGGAMYAFRFDNAGPGWIQTTKLLSPDGERFDMAGHAVGVHNATALVGVPGDNEQGTSAGAFYGFRGYSGIDCNGNGEDDVCEIIAGDASDLNGNDVPDECDVLGDLDGDGVVGITDFLTLLAAWGPCPDPCPPHCIGDLEPDCDVNVTDFLILLANWS